jgi:hypothetical protein
MRKIKIALIYSVLSISLDTIRRIIYSKFDLSSIFNFDFLLFEVLIEGLVLIITAILSNYFTKKIETNNLKTFIIRIFTFTLIYSAISFTTIKIVSILLNINTLTNFYSFLNFIPNGLIQSFIFLLVSTIFKNYTTKIRKEIKKNANGILK